MTTNIRSCIKVLEKLSLVTCSNDVLQMLERALKNVQPILEVNTRGTEPLLWQNELSLDRLHKDEVRNRLRSSDLKRNASGFFEDYIAVGIPPKSH